MRAGTEISHDTPPDTRASRTATSNARAFSYSAGMNVAVWIGINIAVTGTKATNFALIRSEKSNNWKILFYLNSIQ